MFGRWLKTIHVSRILISIASPWVLLGDAGAFGEIGWRAMQTTDDFGLTVASQQEDLREVPLADMPALSSATRDEMLRRVMRNPGTAPVPGMKFGSAI